MKKTHVTDLITCIFCGRIYDSSELDQNYLIRKSDRYHEKYFCEDCGYRLKVNIIYAN